jgi:hypothetical protein
MSKLKAADRVAQVVEYLLSQHEFKLQYHQKKKA